MESAQNERCERQNVYEERFLDFAADTIRFLGTMEKSYISTHIGKQLLRSATSMGSNYEESRGAESRADFVHKLQIVLKEARETVFWLRVLQKVNIGDSAMAARLLPECRQLTKIIASSVVTAKKRMGTAGADA